MLEQLALSERQRENLESGNIDRLPVGVFACGFTGSAHDEENQCDHADLWEGPLEDMWWEWAASGWPECPECQRPAILVNVSC